MQFNAGEGGGMSNNQKHLEWIYNRLVSIHKENPNVDYMLRLRRIIDVCSTPAIRAALATEPEGPSERDIAEILERLEWKRLPQAEGTGNSLQLDLALAVLARWGCPTAPPAPEVMEAGDD
jgi:hypothetical protein